MNTNSTSMKGKNNPIEMKKLLSNPNVRRECFKYFCIILDDMTIPEKAQAFLEFMEDIRNEKMCSFVVVQGFISLNNHLAKADKYYVENIEGEIEW